MEYFKNLIYSICGAGIIASVFRILVSNSKLQKSINIFLSMFIFLYTVIPIGNLVSDFNFDFNMEIAPKSYEDIYKDGYNTIIYNSINNVCKKYDKSIIDIAIDSYIDDEGYLVVNSIELRLNSDDKNSIVAKELKEMFNFEVIFV